MKAKTILIIAVIALGVWIWYRKKVQTANGTESSSLFGSGSVYDGSLINWGSLFSSSTSVVTSDTSTSDGDRRTTGTTDSTDSSTSTTTTVTSPTTSTSSIGGIPSAAYFTWSKPKSPFPWRN